MYGTDSKALADALAIKAFNAWHMMPIPAGRRITGCEARPHAWDARGNVLRWGVWPLWRYIDRADCYAHGFSNGGPFLSLDAIRRLPALVGEIVEKDGMFCIQTGPGCYFPVEGASGLAEDFREAFNSAGAHDVGKRVYRSDIALMMESREQVAARTRGIEP